jgi:hypothetical protein
MTLPRARLLDVSITRWYRCITRCVRHTFLLAAGKFDRTEWIERRLEELAEIVAVSVGGFSVMDHHLQVLARLDSGGGHGWSDEEVLRRWGRLFPPSDRSRQPLPVSSEWIARAGWPEVDDPALPDRGSARARITARRDAARILNGRLPAPGRLHRPTVL